MLAEEDPLAYVGKVKEFFANKSLKEIHDSFNLQKTLGASVPTLYSHSPTLYSHSPVLPTSCVPAIKVSGPLGACAWRT